MTKLVFLKKIPFQLISLAILILVIYYPTLIGIFKKVSNSDDFSYALIIPFIVAYLVWEKRKNLSNTTIKPYWPGLVLIVFNFLFSIYGVLGSDISAARISWWLWIVSITLFCYGKDIFKVLFIPLIILAFVIPLPQHIYAPLTLSLKLISSKLAFYIISLAGIPVHVEGNIIDLGDTQLHVVDACSGLRYVLPLMAVAILYAHYSQRHWFKKLILILITLPLSMIMNGLRVGIIAILYKWVSPKVVESFYHELSGWFIFILSFGLLIGLNYILNLLPPKHKDFTASKNHKNEKSKYTKNEHKNNLYPFCLTFTLLCILFISSICTTSLPRIKLANGINSFPLHFKDWNGVFTPIDPEIIKRSGAEESFQATYINSKNEMVSLYIGYRSTPFMESEEFFHSPTVCLPSSGWKILEKSSYKIPNVSYRYNNFVVTRLLVSKMGKKQLVYFWFQTKDKISRNIFENRFHLTLSALKRDNTYDITVHVYTIIKENESIKDAQKRLNGFVRDFESEWLKFFKSQKVLSFK
ncbi:exosortase C-terminal domain/associated protein EpsI [Desulfothermus sp.]